MKIGIVGFGREGRQAYEYWNKDGNTFFIFDQRAIAENIPHAEIHSGVTYKQQLIERSGELDLIVRSPGVPLWDIADTIQAPITTITREFFDVCPCPIIGVTGTKGKGTTATLIYRILKEAGKNAYLVGNIGVPALSVLSKLHKDSVVVYELSSFQLFDLHKSPAVAVCLLVTEDHLDWHKDLAQYHASKGNIFAHQSPDDTAIWFVDNPTTDNLHKLSRAKNAITYGNTATVRVENEYFMYKDQRICKTTDAKLPGVHNQQNICAAIAATWNLVDPVHIVHVIKTWQGLPYHIETVGTHRNITFINDSFSTNPTSTEVAVASVTAPTTLLIGGVDRGLPLERFAEAIKKSNNIRHVVCFGEERHRIHTTLKENLLNSTIAEGTFEAVFKVAVSLTKPGETVLFSPGAPSFDMFENYEARGVAFNALVAQYRDGLL